VTSAAAVERDEFERLIADQPLRDGLAEEHPVDEAAPATPAST